MNRRKALIGIGALTLTGVVMYNYLGNKKIDTPKLKQGDILADLHMHGPIGFQAHWLEVQGYYGRNLLQLIAEECFHKNIGICAITSEEDEIPVNSVHDRFNRLVNYARKLPEEYKVDKLDDIALIIEKYGKQTIIVNSQTVIVMELSKDGKIRFDHLVIGGNQVPNQMSLEDTIKYSHDKELIQVAEHAFVKEHFGIGEELLIKHLDDYDAIEIHNAQLLTPALFSFLPTIGPYNKGTNEKAYNFAVKHNKPGIATSDAHRIEDLGIAYTVLNFQLDLSNGKNFLKSLRDAILSVDIKNPKIYPDYESWWGVWDYKIKFNKGMKNREKYGV